MAQRLRLLLSAVLFLPAIVIQSSAQLYVGPLLGLRTLSMNGSSRTFSQDSQNDRGVLSDRPDLMVNLTSSTPGFGITAGWQLFTRSRSPVAYRLDLSVDAILSRADLLREEFQQVNGKPLGSLDRIEGGKTWIWSFQLLPLHRLSFVKLPLLSPFAGLGLALTIFSTQTMTLPSLPDKPGWTWNGTTQTQAGIVLSYGTLIAPGARFQPFVQFKHVFPFGSETQFSGTGTDEKGWFNNEHYVKDVPAYFYALAGVRMIPW